MSYVDINREEGLWQWMAAWKRRACRSSPCPTTPMPAKDDVRAGRLLRKALDGTYAALRARFEPLIEMMQIKATRRCTGSSGRLTSFADSRMPIPSPTTAAVRWNGRNFVRYGLVKGLAYEKSLGVNPEIRRGRWHGQSQWHAGQRAEDNWGIGSHGGADGTVERRRTGEVGGWAKARDLNRDPSRASGHPRTPGRRSGTR